MNAQENERALKTLLAEYLESYAINRSKMQVTSWLAGELAKYLPDKTQGEINAAAEIILTTLSTQQDKAKSLQEALNQGKSKEKWFADEIKKLALNERDKSELVQNLGSVVSTTHSELAGAITGSTGQKTEIKALSRLEDIAKEIGHNSLMTQIITDDLILESEHSMNTESSLIQEVIKDELSSGDSLGLKAAVAGAGYTAAEREIIRLPEECKPSQCASIAQTVTEKARIAGGFTKLAVKEGVNLLERLAVSNVIGFLVAALGTRAAASLVYSVCVTMLGSVTGAGVASVFAVITPEVLYSAGAKLGEEAMSHLQKERPAIVNKTVEAIKKGAEVIKNAAKSALKLFG
ncbi:MAG: hypothetical protein IJR35_07525 [Synergistaceae bacterium]|nr:hypothetical protein [Synergistaceae bacterium]